MELFAAYIPMDRRQALARNLSLPERSEGAALFADISGFTPLTEALTRSLGQRRGAEELTLHLNSVYQALIHEVDRYGGSVIAFAGDAITCWFDGDPGCRAIACALAMQATMAHFKQIKLAESGTFTLAVKIGIARGPARRFLAGDPQIQILDVLAGRTLSRMAAAAHLAARGQIIVAPEIAAGLGNDLTAQEWRKDPGSGDFFAVVGSLRGAAIIEPWPDLPPLSESVVRPWLIDAVYDRLRAGLGEFLTELRPAVAIFVRFDGIDYDGDEQAGVKLGAYVSWVQRVTARLEGVLVDVAVGDKGSYLYACFGAPIAHENDAWRAVVAAQELARPPAELSFVAATHIGISAGTMRTGAYGGATRRTYGVLGDEVNLAARLMEHAEPGQVLVSDRLWRVTGDAFAWRTLPAIKAKGKTQAVQAFALAGEAQRTTSRLVQPKYSMELVGREAELSIFEEKIQSARAGKGQVLCLCAEAGMGKSRLVAEAIRRARNAGFKTHIGECQSHGTHTSYLCWQTIWQRLFGLEATQPPAVQIPALELMLSQMGPLLSVRLPLLGTLLNVPIPDNEVTAPLEARLRKASLEALLVECLRFIAAREPLLLVLEDTHWIDMLSCDLLDVLARSILHLPVLLVFTQRPKEKGYAQVQGLEQLACFTEVALPAFTEKEAARLIELKLAQLFDLPGPTPAALVARLTARSAGNPFYLEELLNFLKAENVDLHDANALERLEWPTSLHSLVLSRIDRLTETQQASLKVASVVGRVFSAVVVWEVQPEQDHPRVAGDLAALCEEDLTVLDSPEPDLTYLFKHVVTQEVAYESLAHATRSKLHTEIGRCLEKLLAVRAEPRVDLLAFHFDRGLDIAKKRQYLRLAGRAAQANYANSAAIAYYERVLPLLEAADRVDTLLDLGKVHELTGEWKRAGPCYQQAFEVAESLNEHSAKARCKAAMGDLLRKQGLFADATNWLGIARTAFEEIGDQAGVSQTLHALGTVSAMQGDYAQARSFYEQSLVLRRQLQDKPQIASLLSNLGIIARFNAQYDTARQLMQQSLEIRRELGDRWAIANSLNNLGVLLRDLGEFPQARTLLEEGLLLNRQVGDRWAVANTLTSLGEVTIDQSDWPAAHGFLEQSLRINQELDDRTAVAFVLECFACMASAQRAVPRAFQLAGAAANLRKSIGSPLSPAEQERLDKNLQSARELVPAAQANELYEQGTRLTLEQAIAIAVTPVTETAAAIW